MTSKKDIKQMRSIGHKLKPVVTVAGKGLSEGVRMEIERAWAITNLSSSS